MEPMPLSIYSALLMLAIGVGSGNNYAYLVVDDKSKDAVIIDPAHPEECVRIRAIREKITDKKQSYACIATANR